MQIVTTTTQSNRAAVRYRQDHARSSKVIMSLILCVVLLGTVGGACSRRSSDSGTSSSKPPTVAKSSGKVSPKDLTAADIKALKVKIPCGQKTYAKYCAALDRFVKGSAPSPSATAIYPGSSLFVALVGSSAKIEEEASYFILMKGRAMYDKVIPENEKERRQVRKFLQYFQQGKLLPASDPIVTFCKSLKTKGASATAKVGNSLKYERVIKKHSPNQIYIRNVGDTLMVIELRNSSAAKTRVFFVGVFPKASKIEPAP